MPLVSLIQPLTTFLEKFDLMLTWQHKQEGFIVCLETSQRTASKRSKASNFRPTLHPWNSTRLATPNAYQLIALCLCNKLTRYGSPLKKVAGLMGAGLLPPPAFFSSTSTDFCLAILVSGPCAELAFFVTQPGRQRPKDSPLTLELVSPKRTDRG